ncbi:MAG: hypothetical protein ABSC73_05525 [Acidimicrobiales bacterium]
MIDHILLDIIGAIREALEGALLEQLAVEERFQVDVFLGDIAFETSYSLPGEQNPPRVRADLGLEWPTWSQSAYRSWSIGEPIPERPELVVELTLRLQRLAAAPDAAAVLAALGESRPELAGEPLERSGITVEQALGAAPGAATSAIEITYQGTYRLSESVLEEPERLDGQVAPLARWIASALVRLADLELPSAPVDDSEAST